MKRIAENNLYNENYSATIFIISEVTVIPRELENYITIFDIPLPTIDEIRGIIRAFITDMEIEVDADTIDEIALSFKGLNEFQIRQILTLAYQDGGCITRGDKALILKEKEQFIKKSGMLEIVNFSESIQKTVEKIDIKPASLDDKKEKEPDPSQVYMKAAKAKV